MFLHGLTEEKKRGEVIDILAEEDISLVKCRDFAIIENTGGGGKMKSTSGDYCSGSPTEKRR
jgi:hypothetical protein